MATPGVGEDIEDICTRCGDTWHVVMAKLGDKVVKVVCKLCGSQHNYRGEKNAAPAAGTTSSWGAARRRKPAKKTEPAPIPTPDFDPTKPPRPYTPREGYAPGERVEHPSFGTGIVAAIPGPGKMDVVFTSGQRTLACAKVESTLSRPVAVNVPIADRPPDKR